MGFDTQRWFDQPGARLEASGLSIGDSYRYPHGVTPNGGVLHPRRKVLSPPAELIRFGGIGTVHHTVIGNWWMEWAEYENIEVHARETATSIAATIRAFCCVPPEWSNLSMVLRARVIATLAAYSGPSAPSSVDKLRHAGLFTHSGAAGARVGFTLLFIPGMASRDLVRDALVVERYRNLPPSP